ncbi:glucan biosynthesis protein G [Acuticoccus sp. MNP-M23]|uniref:glucan biosynthesis protein n=1 Tax=Acuticoccus sp. MNP-M23 TaxID=3072793 RepID=UPI0028152FB3|nr:glucan biosynthesis protein G [Acuticoccus sp. MNP-M23]WMS44983.1 glucan biosynthesis protein G [Acuticoccus sp. MNP-M23]
MPIARRQLLKGAVSVAALAALELGGLTNVVQSARAELLGAAEPFSRAALAAAAEALSKTPFVDPRAGMPEALTKMTYDGYRAMRMGPDFPIALSEADAFHMDPLLAGFVFRQPVDLFLVEGDSARRIQFDRDMYVFDPPADTQAPDGDIPFSGFRLRTPINNPDVNDEFVVFQGASYFRAIGKGETYGLSARGLAINTGQPTGEEFPFFRAFYVEKPRSDAKAVVIHALLDSPSTTGVYRITVRPGDSTQTDVELTLFPRKDIETIGFAPFSSMFLFDSMNRSAFDDYRDAVHDSDGLSMLTGGGEWLWRPLYNPQRLEVSAFVDTTPRGFGLVQRKRSYVDYQDAEARYQSRPTAWVEPIGDWGTGAVVLFEIPTDSETNDNVVAYWQPDKAIVAGEPFSLTYRIHWDADTPVRAEGPRVESTRHGRNFFDTDELFVIDYALGDATPTNIAVDVQSSAGKVKNVTHYMTPEPGILRVSFELDPDANETIELRASLTADGIEQAEKWLFRWTA